MRFTSRVIASLLLAILPLTVFASGNGAAESGGAGKKTLLKAIVLSMGTDSTSVTNPQYDALFQQGNAEAGVAAVIAAGKFFINGYAMPGTASAYAKAYPDGFRVNQVPWLYYDASAATWKGGFHGEKTAPSYEAAALAVASGIVAGLEVRLYDTTGNGYTDLIEADYKEGTAVNRITRNSDGSYSVYRGDIDAANQTTNDGRVFDGAHFTSSSGETIKPANFDKTIKTGDIALFWYGPNGWVMQRAKEAHGLFVDGADHQSYDIGGTVYQDAMRFSRDNVLISNRPGEFVNAQKYFHLNNNHEGWKVSLWLVPTTWPSAQGAPVAITSPSNSRAFLTKAIAVAKQRLASATVSRDGSDVPASRQWVTQDAHTQLSQAISRADAALASASSSASLLDYQVYLLYLALNGSGNDIGAKFAGFTYTGFDKALKPGTLAQ